MTKGIIVAYKGIDICEARYNSARHVRQRSVLVQAPLFSGESPRLTVSRSDEAESHLEFERNHSAWSAIVRGNGGIRPNVSQSPAAVQAGVRPSSNGAVGLELPDRPSRPGWISLEVLTNEESRSLKESFPKTARERPFEASAFAVARCGSVFEAVAMFREGKESKVPNSSCLRFSWIKPLNSPTRNSGNFFRFLLFHLPMVCETDNI